MSEVKNYQITTKNHQQIIESDRTEYMPNTGQTLFYLKDSLMHIAPADAFVSNVQETIHIKQRFQDLDYFIEKQEQELKKSWKPFLDKNGFFDAPDDKISDEDKTLRQVLLAKVNLLQEFKNVIVKE